MEEDWNFPVKLNSDLIFWSETKKSNNNEIYCKYCEGMLSENTPRIIFRSVQDDPISNHIKVTEYHISVIQPW